MLTPCPSPDYIASAEIIREGVQALYAHADDIIIDGEVFYPSMIAVPDLDIDGVNAYIQVLDVKLSDFTNRFASMEDIIARKIMGEG